MEENQEKKYLFEEMPIPRAYLTLSVPVILTSLVTMLYNLADTFFVGMLGDPVQNAAVTLVYPVILAFFAANNLFGVGTSSMMSRCLGAGQEEQTRVCSAFGFYGALAAGLLFSIFCTLFQDPLLRMLGADEMTWEATHSYLMWTVMLGAAPAIVNVVQGFMVRSEGAALHAGLGTMSGCILNMILDPFFILPWGLDMGAAGAGLATFISNCAACTYFIVLARVKGKKTYISTDPRKLMQLSRRIVMGITTVGVPAAIQNLVNVVGVTLLNNFTAGFGAAAVASMGIAQKLHGVVFQIMQGSGQGVMPLVSYNYTGGNRKRMRDTVKFAMCINIPLGILATVLYWVKAPELISLFLDKPEIVAIGTRLLRGMSLSMVCLGIDFMTVGVFQALGFGRYALVYAMMRKVIMEIPLLILLNRLCPLYGLPFAQVISEFVLAVTSFFMLRRIFRKSMEEAPSLNI